MKFYNTLTRQKEEFKPINEGEVTMYVCGPTVYNYIHVGNARPLIVFDALRRYFKHKGYKVKYLVNFTDIDDKMINRANDEDTTVKEIADRFIKEYYVDVENMQVGEEDTIHPRATENIGEIIKFIKELEAKGYAYNVDGNVYFEVNKAYNYGRLSNKNLEDLISGSRVDISDEKKNPMDFALWKKEKPGEPSWGSPWGKGRPGWHIECSVMARKYLGDTIDIHAGGHDLEFPHHENEIAQSESLTGKTFANFWMHNAMLNVDNQKMSKSKQNFFTVREVSKLYDLEILRLFMLSSHYRSQVNFSEDIMEQFKNALDRLYNGKKNMEHVLKTAEGSLKEEEKAVIETARGYEDKFMKAMDDDLNTADAISFIFELVKLANSEFNSNSSKELVQEIYNIFVKLTGILAIVQKEDEELEPELMELIEKRIEARENKDYALSDQLRDELKEKGILVEDSKEGMKWKRIK